MKVLILYYSKNGSVKKLAQLIAQGVEAQGCESVLRTVPDIGSSADQPISDSDPYVCADDLIDCSALALGSPSWFGNMAAPLKHFFDGQTQIWLNGDMIDKPAVAFTSSSSMHGGQETTLNSMLLPLMHHGMVIMGIPYSEPDLHTTATGGTPYGASHLARNTSDKISQEEKNLALALGKRLAQFVRKLN